MKKTIDAVICTKSRPKLLLEAAKRVKENIKPSRLFIYDGSRHQDDSLHSFLKSSYDAVVIDVRGLRFGAVRRLSMKNSTAKYVAMIDDDVIYGKDWLGKVLIRFQEKGVVAVNGRLILGNKGTIVYKISCSAFRDSGGSGGACVYDRRKIIELGNFDKNIHRGEDMELKLRIEANGYRWVKSCAVAFHPISNMITFFKRGKVDAIAWEYILCHSKHRTKFLIERVVSVLVMPVYYGWRVRDVRAWGCWLIFRLNSLFSFLAKRYEAWE